MISNESADYRAFRGIWIPAEVWISKEMTLQEKVMLVEINSLQHPERGCFKSNRALAEFFQLSISRVSEIIASLDRKGLVRVDLIRDGRQVVERRIFMSTPFGIQNTHSGKAMNPFGKGDEPPSGKAKESNTSMRGSGEYEDLAPTAHSRLAAPKRPAVPVQAIIDAYHELLPMCPQVRKLTETRRRQIEARWRAGDLPDVETWRDYFTFCAQSKFLTGLAPAGPGQRPFIADLEWLSREGNYAKVYERKYHR